MTRRLAVMGLGVVVLAALVPVASVGASHATFDATVAAQLQAVIERYERERPLPGIAASVLMADGSRWDGVAGEAEVGAAARPVTPHTTFVAGSITKTFVAALVLRLAEDGVLSIDDPLASWMPEFPGSEAVTLRQLLDHTSGLFDYFHHPDYARLVFGRPRHLWTVDEILALVGAPYFAPGTDFRYSNTNYVLLGEVVQRATARPVGALIRERFIEPLGLTDTFFQGHDPLSLDGAHGYLRSDGDWVLYSDGSAYRPHTSAATVAWAAGAMVSTAHDLSMWADALYGGAVLQPASLAAMVDAGGDGYGLGTRSYLLGGRTVWGHGGSLRGFEAMLWYLPDHDITISVLTNRGRHDVERIAERLGDVVFRHFHPDTTVPAAVAPAVSFRTDAAIASGGLIPVTVSWSAVETESGVASVELQHSLDGGAWSSLPVAPPARGEPAQGQVPLQLPARREHRFQLRVSDRAGNVSEWVVAERFRILPVQERNRSIAWSGAWRTGTPADAYGSALAWSRSAGSTATVRVTGSEVAWVSRRGAQRGRAALRVDGTLVGTVDLRAASLEPKRVVQRFAWLDGSSHDVELRVLGTATRPRVDLDAFLVLQVLPDAGP